MRREPLGAEARLDFVAIQGRHFADGSQAEGVQRLGKVFAQAQQADRVWRHEGGVAPAGDEGGQAVRRYGGR